jgi:hypothetical protein
VTKHLRSVVGRHGVLVTQHTNTFYTVTLSKDVPTDKSTNGG